MMRIPVLYEDNHLLAVIKPPGVLSQADDTGDDDMLTLLKLDLKERHNKPGNVFLGLVHRLDRGVGGVMIFAKTSKAASRLSEAVRSRTFGKTYLCVVHGSPKRKNETRLTHYILKDNKRNQVTVYPAAQQDAKEAVLDYRVAAATDHYSLIAVRLHTGRPHQIRAQLSYIGCPLVGDLKYGAKKTAGIVDPVLWSTSITVPHPITKELISFHAAPAVEGAWSWWDANQLESAARMFSAEQL